MSGIVLTGVTDATIPTPASGKDTVYFSTDQAAPSYKDDTGTVHTLKGAAGADAPALTYLDHGNTGSTETIDASAGDVQRLVANAATVTLTLTGWPASGTPAVVRCWLEQDGTGGRVWSWPGAVTWGDAGEPDWSTRSGGDIDIVDLMTVDGGTTVEATVAGRAGAIGPTGGGIAIPYTFSTTTTDSDPGNGNLRLDNATQNAATAIRADLLDSNAADWTTVIDSLDDSTNTVKGHLRLFKTDDPTKYLLFTVSAVDSSTGYRNITVANVGSSASSPFADADAITLTFTRAGDKGADGAGSGTLTTIEEVDGSPTDSAVTKLVLPNGSLVIASHVATYTPPGSHSAKLYHNTTQAGGNNATISLAFNAEEFDSDAYHFTSAAALTGTVSKSAGSAIVTGVGTNFTGELSPNQVVTIPGTATEYFVVKTVDSATQFTAWANAANNASGQTATRVNTAIAFGAGLGGRYEVGGGATTATNVIMQMWVRKNGATDLLGTSLQGGNAAGNGVSYTNLIEVADGDFIELRLYTSATNTIESSGVRTPTFWVKKAS